MELRLGRRALAVPALAATLTAAAGLGGFLLSRAHERDGDRQASLRAAAPAIASFGAAVDAAVSGSTRLGTGPEDAPAADAAAARSGLEAVLLVRPGPDGSAGTAITAAAGRGVPVAADPVTRAALEATLDVARDRGEVRATPAVGVAGGGGPVTLIVVPRYRAGQPTGTTAQRRVALDGYTIGLLRPASAAAASFGPLAASGAAIEVRDGDVSLFRAGSRDADANGDALVVRLPVAGRNWAVTTEPPAGDAGGTPSLVLGAGLALALLILASGRRSYTVERQATAEAAAREQDLGAVAAIGPLLQQSLDLADVLPSASAFLVDHFELDGVTIAYAGEQGDLVEAFTVGRRLMAVPRAAAELRSPPTRLQAGETASVPLLRGGRVIGALHALARVDLSSQRTRTFVTVAELIGTTLDNARQFEREQEAVQRLREVDRLKNEFLGTVSHELQTPITAILGFSSILDEQYEVLTAQERKDFVGRVARNATSLSSLVRELLDFSRLGRRGFELHLHEIDLSELTERVVDQFGALVERHQLLLEAPPGVWALADSEAVERVLANLLSNAAKYSPPGTLITVALSHDVDVARLIVDDEGPGVSEDDAPHVFSRFYRGNSPATVATRGAGIGLAIVKDLVDRMEGSVSVGVSPAGGARFTVVLPVHKREPTVPPIASSEPAGQGRLP